MLQRLPPCHLHKLGGRVRVRCGRAETDNLKPPTIDIGRCLLPRLFSTWHLNSRAAKSLIMGIGWSAERSPIVRRRLLAPCGLIRFFVPSVREKVCL